MRDLKVQPRAGRARRSGIYIVRTRRMSTPAPRREHQHEDGRPNAFEVADTQMRDDGPHEVEHQADSRRDSEFRPPHPCQQPSAPAHSQTASSGKYSKGTPTVRWITFTWRGSRRIFPRPENAAISATSTVIPRYTVRILAISR